MSIQKAKAKLKMLQKITYYKKEYSSKHKDRF